MKPLKSVVLVVKHSSLGRCGGRSLHHTLLYLGSKSQILQSTVLAEIPKLIFKQSNP